MSFTSLEVALIFCIVLYGVFIFFLTIIMFRLDKSHKTLNERFTQLGIDIVHMTISDENIPNVNCKLGCNGKGKVNIGEGILERPCLCTLRLDFDDRK